jgi:flagellar FliL protein
MKKLLVIGLVLLLLLGAGGGAAWWFLLREPPGEAMAAGEARPPDKVFVDFEPMVVSVLRGGYAAEHLTFMIILQVTDQEARSTVFRQTLLLRDAFRAELHAVLSSRLMQDRENAMPVLSKRLKAVSDRLVGSARVERVLINVMTRRQFEDS